jgi:hypothetical protein
MSTEFAAYFDDSENANAAIPPYMEVPIPKLEPDSSPARFLMDLSVAT